MVPMAKPVQHVAEDTVFDITVRAWGCKEGSFTLYEDDFVSCQHETQGSKPITIRRAIDGSLTVEGMENSRKYRMAMVVHEKDGAK